MAKAEARELRSYQKLIHDIDPAVNAAGVEGHMRNQYWTLDHLGREDFRVEIALARTCEAAEPGYLRSCAVGQGLGRDYENAKAWIKEPSRIVSDGGEIMRAMRALEDLGLWQTVHGFPGSVSNPELLPDSWEDE